MSEAPSPRRETPEAAWWLLPRAISAWVRTLCHRVMHDPVGELLTPELTKEILDMWEKELEADRKHNPHRAYDMEEYHRRFAVLNGIVDMHYAYLVADHDLARQVRYRLIEAAGLIHYT